MTDAGTRRGEYRASPLLASGCQRESLDRRRHSDLIAAWKFTFPF